MKSDVRLLWFLTAAISIAGVYRLEAHYERAIDASKTAIETLYRHTSRNLSIVARATVLQGAQRSAQLELRDVSRERTLSGATASLLVTLEDTARRSRVQVQALQPGTTVTEGGLIATDIALRTRGTFANLIAFLQDVSHHADIVSVSRTDLALSSQPDTGSDPKLDATIHATLYRLKAENAAGDKNFAPNQ